MLFNFFIILLLLTGVVGFAALSLEPIRKEDKKPDRYAIEEIITTVDHVFAKILDKDYRSLNLNQKETMKRENIKKHIKQCLKKSAEGDKEAKEYIKDYIKEILLHKVMLNEENIEKVIPFQCADKLTEQDKFEILLQQYEKEYKKDGFQKFLEKNRLDTAYTITALDLEKAYFKEMIYLSFEDKIEIIAQRVYQQYRGFGIIDRLREMKIDGVSAGISAGNLLENIEGTAAGFQVEELPVKEIGDKDKYNPSIKEEESLLDVWIFYKGRTIRLDFLRFPSEKELIRVCKSIYRHNNPGYLSETRGYLVNDMKDGSRVVVFRPPIAVSWAFFVRKHDNIIVMDIRKVIREEGSDQVIELLKWMVKGCLSIAITGEMGSGKTTLLKLLIQYIDESYPIRVFEQVYELNLTKAYPKRNILSLRDSPEVSGQEILNVMKKTDGSVLILGEVASHETANYLIEISQISKMTLFSHHAETTQDLISYFKISQLKEGGFHKEELAEYQAANAINIDIHLENKNGHRYISRITEIIPYYKKDLPGGLVEATQEYYKRRTSPVTYETRDILSFVEGKYVLGQDFSDKSQEHIFYHLSDSEGQEYREFMKGGGLTQNG
ncbi:ATPase, T2SS/T4P/T4SS family [Anaerocolumna sp. AGMB13020]|uniref:ATPase, T2SS/T4P/T4SS family n=1 Tax=Anaerocolumna sp. AGMB13020 TaxID=3081750 RepID=UPI002953A93C|nr:ATPase, T2SS/T4P/T4SS family [Anaerocolumna sp. AGMB13020]WOO36112.1 ATPase, T2SS/T4P/T4SS family [Anaerocolumna sp. AGMB13020]